MKNKLFNDCLTLIAVLGALMCAVAPAGAADKKPNILVIMTDDVGWGDLGCYGGGEMRGAPTPNLDRLASEGMRFVNYYGQASCTAGRASFITGRIPIRTALSLVLFPGDPDGLTAETPTVAEFFKKAAIPLSSSASGISAISPRPTQPPTVSMRCITCCLTTPESMPIPTPI